MIHPHCQNVCLQMIIIAFLIVKCHKYLSHRCHIFAHICQTHAFLLNASPASVWLGSGVQPSLWGSSPTGSWDRTNVHESETFKPWWAWWYDTLQYECCFSRITSVSSHTEKLKFCKISTTASLTMARPSRMPTQFLGPIPNGRKVYGLIFCLFCLLNLKHIITKESQLTLTNRDILFLKFTCKSKVFMQAVRDNNSVTCALYSTTFIVPVWSELLWLGPQLRVIVQSVDWNRN